MPRATYLGGFENFPLSRLSSLTIQEFIWPQIRIEGSAEEILNLENRRSPELQHGHRDLRLYEHNSADSIYIYGINCYTRDESKKFSADVKFLNTSSIGDRA